MSKLFVPETHLVSMTASGKLVPKSSLSSCRGTLCLVDIGFPSAVTACNLYHNMFHADVTCRLISDLVGLDSFCDGVCIIFPQIMQCASQNWYLLRQHLTVCLKPVCSPRHYAK